MLAPVREWKMGRDEEIAYAREHGIPIKGGTEAPPYSIDDNLWGRSSEGRTIEDLSEPTPDDVFQLVTRPEEAPDEPELVRIGFEAGAPVSIDGERARAGRADRAGGRARRPPRGRDRRPHRGPDRRAQGPRHLRGARGGDPARRPTASSRSSSRRSTRTTSSARSRTSWAYLCYAGLWHEPLRADLDAYMDSANEHVTGEVTVKLYKGSATRRRA